MQKRVTLSNVSCAKGILHRSFKLNNMIYNYVNSRFSDGPASSDLHVNVQFLCQGLALDGPLKTGSAGVKNAEASAALKALDILQRKNPVIRAQIKNKETRYNPKNLHGYNKQVIEVETP